MTDQPGGQPPTDDTEGHGRMHVADAEQAEGDADTEGHHFSGFGHADAEQAEGDDTEGHHRMAADAEQAEGDDTEGHGRAT